MQVHSVKKSRTVRQLHIHHCAHPLTELSELKTSPDLWRKVCTANSCLLKRAQIVTLDVYFANVDLHTVSQATAAMLHVFQCM